MRELGRRAYAEVLDEMRAFTDARDAQTPDEFWLVEHDPVFTQGQAGKAEHVLAPGDIPVIQSDRGGQVTYHGPGQLVCYLLLDIRRRGMGVRDLVSGIEQAIIDLLKDEGIDAYARREAPGVYVADAKVAQLGLRVRHGRSYHGLALNVAMDLEPFARINPCGFEGLRVTDLRQLGVRKTGQDIQAALLAQLAIQFEDEQVKERG